MTLHEAIKKVLTDSGTPLTAKAIASILNKEKYYPRSNGEELTTSQISTRIKNYPSLFQTATGRVALVENNNFSHIINSYHYLSSFLRGVFISEDIQFINAVLIFYKRLIDINDRPGRRYPISHISGMEDSISKLIDGGNTWLKNLNELELYQIGPAGIFEECSRLLAKLENSKKTEIWSIISQLETAKILDDEFGKIFGYLINSGIVEGTKFNAFHTPESLKKLMVELLRPMPGKSIYDPVAGTGSLLIQALNYNADINKESKGTEINKRIAQLGNMNLIMNGLSAHTIYAQDCFEEINNNKQYDYIIADLPISGILNSYEHFMLLSQYGMDAPKSGKGFTSLVLFVLSKLKHDGKAVITVSNSFLFSRGKEKEVRDLLIKNDFIESVISLPTGTLRPHTDAKAAIIVINKSKLAASRNTIKFIKAKAIDLDKNSLILDNKSVITAQNDNDHSSNHNKFVNIFNLKDDNNISPDAYDIEYSTSTTMLTEGTGKHLAELVEIKAGTQPDKNDFSNSGAVSLVKIENLSKEIVEIELGTNLQQLSNESNQYDRYIIKQDCVLIARIGDKLKPTIFRYTTDRSIILHSSVYALIPTKKNNSLDLHYLYYQLHSAFIVEQIKNRRRGSVMPHVSIAELKQIVIPYVEVDIQRHFVDSQRANLIAAEKAKTTERLEKLGYIEDVQERELNIVRTITHQLKHHLTGLAAILQKINAITGNNDLGEIKEYIGDDPRLVHIPGFEKPENNSLDYTIKKALKKTETVNNILKDVEKAIIFTLEFSKVSIVQLLTEIKQEFIAKNFLIEIIGDNTLVEISKNHFEDLINTLIENAEEHSFIGVKKPRIIFNIKNDINRGVIIIDYKNNGAPLSITDDEYKSILTKSIKSKGTGIGGYYINKIVEAHGGVLNIKENLSSGVHFIIELPIKQFENE